MSVKDLSNKRKKPARRQTAKPNVPAVMPGLTLREYWARLQHAMEVGAPMPGEAASAAPPAGWREAAEHADAGLSGDVPLPAYYGSSSRRSSGNSSRRSSGSSGGSGGLGYGLELILPTSEARRQVKDVMDILRELCEKDAARVRKTPQKAPARKRGKRKKVKK